MKINRNQVLTLFYQIMVFNSILNASCFSRVPYFSLVTRIVLLSLVVFGTIVWALGKRGINIVLGSLVVAFVVISVIVMKESNSQIAIIMLLYLMIIYRDVEPRQFCKKYVEVAVLAMVFVFVLFVLGVFPSEYRYRVLSSGIIRYRYNLGYNQTTTSSNFAFHISLAYLFYKQEKLGIRDAVILLLFNTVLFVLTDTRAAYFEINLVILIFGMLKVIRRDWFSSMIGYLAIWLMPIMAAIELYIANNYIVPNKFYKLIDSALSYRLSWAVKALRVYPIRLFGNSITWESNAFRETSQLVDMFYLRCAIQYGLVFLVVIIIGFMGIGAVLNSQNSYYGCAIILTLALHSITDPQLLEYSCVPLLCMMLTGYMYVLGLIRIRRPTKRGKQISSI